MKRYQGFLFLVLMLVVFSDQADAFWGRSKEKEDVSDSSYNTFDSSQEIDSSESVKEQFLDREEQKIEEFQEIQNSFLEKVNSDDTDFPFVSDPPVVSDAPAVQEEFAGLGDTPDPVIIEPTVEVVPITTVAPEPEPQVVTSTLEDLKQKDPVTTRVTPVRRESQYDDLVDDKVLEEPKKKPLFRSRKKVETVKPKKTLKKKSRKKVREERIINNSSNISGVKIKYCKSCGREFKKDNPRIFCPSDGTPLQTKEQ